MNTVVQKPKNIIALSVVVFIFGIMMVGYWISYLAKGLPLEGIPIASELINAALALVTAYGLFRMRPWSLATGLVLSGMWIYGVVQGINLVIEKGLAFSSPIGAFTDAVIFVIVFIFALFMIIFLWRKRVHFLSG